jgi:hypothetical protein
MSSTRIHVTPLFLTVLVAGCGGAVVSQGGDPEGAAPATGEPSSLLYPATPVPASMRRHSLDSASATPGPSYWQLGAASSPQDQITFDNSQGAKTDLYVHHDHLNNGGCHYYWVAAGVKIPGGDHDIFVQIGYALCGTNPAMPFIYTQGSTLPNSNVFPFFPEHPLSEHVWYAFSFSTNGKPLADGTYAWNFYVQPSGGSKVLLTTIPFESPNARAPYIVTEVAGSSNACGDVADVSYDQSSALVALLNGKWQQIAHANAYYGYGPCPNSNDIPDGHQNVETKLGPTVTMTTPYGSPLW